MSFFTVSFFIIFKDRVSHWTWVFSHHLVFLCHETHSSHSLWVSALSYCLISNPINTVYELTGSKLSWSLFLFWGWERWLSTWMTLDLINIIPCLTLLSFLRPVVLKLMLIYPTKKNVEFKKKKTLIF